MCTMCYYLYHPQETDQPVQEIINNLGDVKRLSFSGFMYYYRQFDDLGEINLNYSGLRRLHENYILLVTDKKDSPMGFCIFKIHRIDLIQIDIIVVRKDLRGQGLGKKIYSRLEQGVDEGTAFYVENNTFLGGLLFKRCGFERDVDLIKVISSTNRLPVDKTRPGHGEGNVDK